MSKSFRVQSYLEHILNAIERIERYTMDMDVLGFLDSDLVQDAVIRNIEIIGEASNKIQRASPEFISQNDNVPWDYMYTMRNRVAHGYEHVDLEIVWKTIVEDLPLLYQQINSLVEDGNLIQETPSPKL